MSNNINISGFDIDTEDDEIIEEYLNDNSKLEVKVHHYTDLGWHISGIGRYGCCSLSIVLRKDRSSVDIDKDVDKYDIIGYTEDDKYYYIFIPL